MALREQIQKDMIAAMKAKESDKVKTLRLLRADIRQVEIDSQKELSDEEVINVLSKAAKKRTDSIEAYKKGGRDDLVNEEQSELTIIKSYLPEELSQEKLTEIIMSVLDETKASSMKDMGKVMGMIMPKVKGRANGKTIQNIVRSKLT